MMILSHFKHGFEKNNWFHDYDTRQNDQYHIPSFKTKLGQSSVRLLQYGILFINLELQKKPVNLLLKEA